MLGPSGFFLPAEEVNTLHTGNDIELIHTSKDGFNELYRVCKNGRFFVYKALKEDFRGNLLYEELLTKDFDIGFSLTHPGLCQYFGKISHPTIGNCIVMEWIDGCTLEEFITTKGISRQLAQKIICEICDALDYMHRKQVIHRDLKPENILITHNGQNVKIIDFGLSDTDSFATFKAPAGTKIYASPELLAGETIDNRSDIWSLGVMISELHPFYKHVAKKCLNRNKDQRSATAVEVKKAIMKEKTRRVWNGFLCGLVCICLFTVIFIIKNNIPKQTEEPFVPSTEFQSVHSSAIYDIKIDDSDTTKAETPAPKTIAPAPPQQTETDTSTIEDLFKEAAEQIL